MIVNILTEHHLEFLIEARPSLHVNMQHCWKSHATADILICHTRKKHHNNPASIQSRITLG